MSTLTIRERLTGQDFRNAVAQVLPRHLTADRFVRIAILATNRTPKLLKCTQASLFNSLMQLSQLGLEPDGRRAHLIPFENRKTKPPQTECQLVIDYKGLAELAWRSGVLASIHADVVCENDEFEYDRGELKRHKIDFRKPRGKPYAAYSLVKFKDGAEKCEVMGVDDILAVRNGSSGWQAFTKGYAKQSPWDPKNPGSEREMWKKTTFRRLSKFLPLTPEYRDAVTLDDDEDRTPLIDVPAAQPALVDVINSLPSDADSSNGNDTDENISDVADEAEESAAGLAPEENAERQPAKEGGETKSAAGPALQDQIVAALPGVTFDDFRDFAKIQFGTDISSVPDYSLLPDSFCRTALSNPRALQRCARTFGKAGAP